MQENNHYYKAIIYDAGLTLIRPHLSIQEVSVLICERFGLSADLGSIKEALSLAQEQFIRVQTEDRQVWASEASIRRMWTDYYSLALRKSGIEAQAELVEACAGAIYDEYGKHQYWQAFPDTMDTLIEGKRRGYVQGVISDWGVQLPEILHNLDLTKYLDFVVVSSLVGICKPNPRIFEFALTRAGVDSHEAVYIGDSYHTDIIGARVAGLMPVLIDRDGRQESVDCAVVRSLNEIWGLVPEARQ